MIAAGLGATDLEDYETPAVRVADWLGEGSPADERRERVAEISAVADGEVM